MTTTKRRDILQHLFFCHAQCNLLYKPEAGGEAKTSIYQATEKSVICKTSKRNLRCKPSQAAYAKVRRKCFTLAKIIHSLESISSR